VIGKPEIDDASCAQYVRELWIAVVSVDHPLAPIIHPLRRSKTAMPRCKGRRRMRACGVECELEIAPGAFHGFDVFDAELPIVRRFRAAQIAALAKHLITRPWTSEMEGICPGATLSPTLSITALDVGHTPCTESALAPRRRL
jgi:hypothetical protein